MPILLLLALDAPAEAMACRLHFGTSALERHDRCIADTP